MKMFNRLMIIGNLVPAILLLLACITPFTPPTRLPHFFSFLSLGVPFLVVANLGFFIYWLFMRKRLAWISFVVLFASYIFLGSFFEFRLRESPVLKEHLSVMTYNVHHFDNRTKQFTETGIDSQIRSFISEQDPDILCFQEYDMGQEKHFSQYPYRYINDSPGKSEQAIFSKFPIVEEGSLDFPETSNNAIYADVLYEQDTIRIYNVHLQSFKVLPSRSLLSIENSEKVVGKLNNAFPKQHRQAAQLIGHRQKTTHPLIICGDFNNTQFSNVYRSIKGEMVDSFDEAGTGYGRTFHFRYFPLRIDFILADETYFEVEAHKNYSVRLSDHFPIMASFSTRRP